MAQRDRPMPDADSEAAETADHGQATDKLGSPAPEHPASVQPIEPENARHVGSSKPAQRELLTQNTENEKTRPHPETVAGQHAVGSFADGRKNPEEETGDQKERG